MEAPTEYNISSTKFDEDDQLIHLNIWGYYYGFFFQVYHPIGLFFCFTGLVTNIINVAVFSSQKIRNSTTFLLAAIAVSDIVVVLERSCRSIIYYITFTISDYVNAYSSMYSKGLYTIEYAALMSSEWLSVTLGIWRFVAITWPFKATTWCTMKRAKAITVCVVVCTLIVSFPCLYFVVTKEATFRGSPVNILAPRSFNGVRYGIEHDLYLTLLWVSVTLPILILVILTIVLIKNILKARHNHKKMVVHVSEEEERKNKTTTMLTVVLVMFILTNLPSVGLTVACLSHNFATKFGLLAYNNFLQSILIIGNSANFFTYLFMNSNYREAFFEIFMKWKWNRDEKMYGSNETITTTIAAEHC